MMKPTTILNILYDGKISLIFYILALIPLFFIGEVYKVPVYIILFIYFAGEIVYKLKYKPYRRPIFLWIDILATIGLITKYQFLVLIRIIKLLSEIRGIHIITNVYSDNKDLFKSVTYLVIVYILAVSLLLFNVEPSTFDDKYYNALYWSVITLTGVGYGDIVPITIIGKVLTIIGALIGIGIVALPAGLISREFLKQKRYEMYEEHMYDNNKAYNEEYEKGNHKKLDNIIERIDDELIDYNLERFRKENKNLPREDYIIVKAYIQINLEKNKDKFEIEIGGKKYKVSLVNSM